MSVPEVGDQVIVNFVHLHPDRPFVMGGMYHGGIASGGGEGNNIMSFSGRSGAELKYDNGAGSVNLKDQGGANMFFDGAGNATTNANKNKEVNVGNDNTVRAGNTNMINVADASVLQMDKTGKVSLTANTEFKIVVGASTIIIDKEGKLPSTEKK